MTSSPNRGEVWLVDLGYVAKVRPCLVVSTAVFSKERALVTLVPHTTRARGTRFEVDIEATFLRSGVFDAQNLVTIPYVKLIKKLGMLLPEQLAQVEEALCLWLDL
ncbi:MAG: type II toxin-antitoxin system PemK/MazF family toxin [Timaviella obliquedivisa GSE-PSE-MK23-08B]|jgi:mRNA interferase MazF|nr:type II toxin-antitoxin system PemK/MazF family toxin [Timaviella obliquedivisa GSE-PSE-MK23-08B]